MNILTNIQDFKEEYIYFYEPIKNNIMADGKFIKLIYSTPNYMLNSINITFDMQYTFIEKIYNKYKCTYDNDACRDIMDDLLKIEENILRKYSSIFPVSSSKIKNLKMHEQFKEGYIKIYQENFKYNACKLKIILRISGIWENADEYGLTYKLFAM